MKADEIRELGPDDIRAKLAELEEERFRLRFRGATESLMRSSPRCSGRYARRLASRALGLTSGR